jgi:transposase InsO family protein
VVHNNGNEFMGYEFQELLDIYGIKPKPMMVKNPTANAIMEQIHGTLGEQLRATVFGADWSDNVDTLIQACTFALRVTSPARGTYSPAQLAFGHDLIF